MPTFLYPPGMNPGRKEYTPDRFNPRQEHIYQALNDAVYGWTHGRAEMMRPTPGVAVDMKDFAKWKVKAIAAWKQENLTRGRGITRGIVSEDFPDSLWIWLYQRIKAAPSASLAAPQITFYG